MPRSERRVQGMVCDAEAVLPARGGSVCVVGEKIATRQKKLATCRQPAAHSQAFTSAMHSSRPKHNNWPPWMFRFDARAHSNADGRIWLGTKRPEINESRATRSPHSHHALKLHPIRPQPPAGLLRAPSLRGPAPTDSAFAEVALLRMKPGHAFLSGIQLASLSAALRTAESLAL